MRIVTLQGESNSGKSTALKMLYFELLKKGAKPVNIPEGVKKQSEKAFQNELSGISHRVTDIAVLVEYKGKRIGIFSAGDSPSLIRTGIWFAAFYGCDILFNAAHSTPSHEACLNAFQSQYGYNIEVVSNTVLKPLDSSIMAGKLFKKI